MGQDILTILLVEDYELLMSFLEERASLEAVLDELSPADIPF